MKCKFCGNDLPEESKFCPSCGAPVEPEEKQEQSEQSTEAKQQENQNPYEYGVPGTDNGSAAQNENPYQYGSAGQDNENPYQYGSAGQNNENPYQYGSTGQNTSADYNANNGTYGQPQKPINGTTYLIFAIISTLLCCHWALWQLYMPAKSILYREVEIMPERRMQQRKRRCLRLSEQ